MYKRERIRKSEKVNECPVCHSGFLVITSKRIYIQIFREDHKRCVLISCGDCGRIKGVIQDEFASYRRLRRQAIEDWGSFFLNDMALK